MRINIDFSYVNDLSPLSKGEELLEILNQNGLYIEKVNDFEPINKDFAAYTVEDIWRVGGISKKGSGCCFLFRGKKEISFSGMATWSLPLPRNGMTDSVGLWLNIKKNHSLEKLVKIGDELFKWSGAMYGYITEDTNDPNYVLRMGLVPPKDCKYPEYVIRRAGTRTQRGSFVSRRGITKDGIADLMWVNYFGTPYLSEPDFNVPDDHVKVGHGVRYTLTESPVDERLCEPYFLESHKQKIGENWFWQNPKKDDLRLPNFYRPDGYGKPDNKENISD